MTESHGEVRKTLVIVLVFNLLVALLKFFFGLAANSLSMIADSLHSFFDSTSNIVGLVALRIASKPADSDHPYGHRKYEAFATLVISGLLLLACFEILKNALLRLATPVSPNVSAAAVCVMVFSMIVNYLVSRYEHNVGHRLGSDILVADSHHTKSDVYASFSVLAGFAAVRLGYPLFDSVIALLISALIGRTALQIIRHSSDILSDRIVVDPKKVKGIVEGVKGVNDCHKVRAHGTRSEAYIDLHILVNKGLSIEGAHEITKAVEKKVADKMPQVKDVVVHAEPD